MDSDYDTATVIKRLLDEIRSANATLTNVQEELYCDERLRGLTLAGGVATLRRQRDEAEARVRALEKELDILVKRG